MWINGSSPQWRRCHASSAAEGRAVDIVVTEDRDLLAAHRSVRKCRLAAASIAVTV